MASDIVIEQADDDRATETCIALLQIIRPEALVLFREALVRSFAHHRLAERERCAADIAEKVREACAEVADNEVADIERHAHLSLDNWQAGRRAIADAIGRAIRALNLVDIGALGVDRVGVSNAR